MTGPSPISQDRKRGIAIRVIADYIKSNRGQSIVEMALILPVLLLLIFGMIDFGRVLHSYLVVTAAAREGARSAAVQTAVADVIIDAKAAAATLDQAQLTVAVTYYQNSSGTVSAVPVRGFPVEVTVHYSVTIITPLLSALQNPFPVTGRAVMRVE